MKIASLFKEVLDEYDLAPFLSICEGDVYNKIHAKIGSDKTDFTTEESAELIAFHSPATYGKDFRFFGKITPEMIQYWEYRSENAKHPLLVARYAGLVHEYSYDVKGARPNHKTSRKHVNALIDIVNQKLYKVPVYAKDNLCRSLEIAIKMNDVTSIIRCKEAIITLENDIAVNDKPGLWGFSYDLLVGGTKKIANWEEENEIVRKLEQRLSALINVDSWATECAVKRLASYYFKENQYNEVKRILLGLEENYEFVSKSAVVIQQLDLLEKLYQYYKQFKLREDARRILIKIRSLSKDANREMKKISASIDVPKEKIDEYVDFLLEGNDSEQIYFRIVEYNIPSIEETQKGIEESSKSSIVQSLFGRSILDKKGRKIAYVGTLVDDPDGHLVLHLSNSIRIGAVLLDFVFREGHKREIFTSHEIIKFLSKSCILNSDRMVILKRGIDAYFNNEYLIAIHLFIPQFEEAIRNLVEMNGGSVLLEKEGVFRLKTFDHILSDPIINKVFGGDLTLYFKVLFTDNRGWNLRNNFAHGLLDISHFNKQNADRVLHALLCLGMVRLREDVKSE